MSAPIPTILATFLVPIERVSHVQEQLEKNGESGATGRFQFVRFESMPDFDARSQRPCLAYFSGGRDLAPLVLTNQIKDHVAAVCQGLNFDPKSLVVKPLEVAPAVIPQEECQYLAPAANAAMAPFQRKR